MDYTLDYIKPTILIYDKEFESKVKESLKRLELQEIKITLVCDDPAAENSFENVLLRKQDISNFEPLDLRQHESPDDLLACIFLSSGSTGRPKGVKISHSMLVDKINSLSTAPEFSDPNVNMFGISPLRWITQLVIMLIPTFFGAQRTVTGKNINFANICSVIDKCKPTTLLGANTFFINIFDHYLKSGANYDFSSLKAIISGGETPSPMMHEKFRSIIPNLIIYYGYGSTECVGPIAMQSDLGNLNGGRLLKGMSCKVLDEDGTSLAPGLSGIVHLKGRVKILGYYKSEAATKKSITDDGWYNTQDYGLMTEDNFLHIFCRYSNIIRHNGQLYLPNDLEEYICKHNSVDTSVIVGIPPDNQKINVYIKLKDSVIDKINAKTQLYEFWKQKFNLDFVSEFELVKGFKTRLSSKGRIPIYD